MSTVDKAFADNIAKHGGWHNGDSDNTMGDNPQVVSIVEYDNAFDGVSYGLVFAGREGSGGFGRYVESEFVRNPRIYWRAAK